MKGIFDRSKFKVTRDILPDHLWMASSLIVADCDAVARDAAIARIRVLLESLQVSQTTLTKLLFKVHLPKGAFNEHNRRNKLLS